ncbi:unnamed protein product [Amoebophrya sp. A25]|nr:unnamed protein product [Amoebophrya sp. A25]|eukprot:GSA25T00022295001.1
MLIVQDSIINCSCYCYFAFSRVNTHIGSKQLHLKRTTMAPSASAPIAAINKMLAGQDMDIMQLGPIIAAFVAVVATFLFWFQTQRGGKVLIRKKIGLQISHIEELSEDTKQIRLAFPRSRMHLGLPVGKHFKIFAPNPGKGQDTWNGREDPESKKADIERAYTPVTGDETLGYVDLVVKMYRKGDVKMPDGKTMTWADGGKMSGCFLDKKKVGDYITIDGPFGLLNYLGRGEFKLPSVSGTRKYQHVAMMAGGSGLTPMLQVIQASLRDPADKTTFSLLYANKTESDILCRDLLDACVKQGKGRVRVQYTLDFPPAGWDGEKGFITQEMITRNLPAKEKSPLVLLCGPPPMVKFACQNNLEALGYDKKDIANF